jgi:hypothetical protein
LEFDMNSNNPNLDAQISYESELGAWEKAAGQVRQERELLALARAPWAGTFGDGLKVVWKTEAGSNSPKEIPVLERRGVLLSDEDVGGYLFGSGNRCLKMAEAWRSRRAQLPAEWREMSWETAISLAASRDSSYWDEENKAARLAALFAWVLTDPSALGM